MKNIKIFEKFILENSMWDLSAKTIGEIVQDIVDENECRVFFHQSSKISELSHTLGYLLYRYTSATEESFSRKFIRLDLIWKAIEAKYEYQGSVGEPMMEDIVEKLENCDYRVTVPRTKFSKKNPYGTTELISFWKKDKFEYAQYGKTLDVFSGGGLLNDMVSSYIIISKGK